MGLLSLVFGGVEGILSEVTNQFNIVEEMATAPLKLIVQTVTGGEWVGEGADAFVKELESLAIPGTGRLGDTINQFGNNISSSVNIIKEADEAVNSLIKSTIGEIFDFF